VCLLRQTALAVMVLLHAGSALADEWEGLRRDAGAVKSIRASFVQTKKMKILARPLVSRGTFHFEAPDAVRWEYLSPVKTVSLVRGGNVKRYSWSGDRGEFVQDSSGSVEAMRIVMEQISGWLAGRFKQDEAFSAVLEAGDTPTVILTPREKSLARFIARVEIRFSARPGVVRSVTIVENESTSTIIEFKDVELNEDLPDTLFQTVE